MQKTSRNSRRQFLTQTTTAALAIGGGLVTQTVSAAKLDPQDALAKSLDYTHASATAGQSCATCQFYAGGAEWGDCAIFPGKQVNAKGWCKSWINKA